MTGEPVHIERELKLRPRDEAHAVQVVARLQQALAGEPAHETTVELESRYLDTAAFHLARCGVGARLRFSRGASSGVWTAKLTEGDDGDGRFEAVEFEVEGELERLPASFAARLRRLVGTLPFVEIARLRNRRTTWRYGTLGEIDLDVVEVLAPRSINFLEVEVELTDESLLASLRQLLADVPVSATHKLGAALRRAVAVDPGCQLTARSVLLDPLDACGPGEPAPW